MSESPANGSVTSVMRSRHRRRWWGIGMVVVASALVATGCSLPSTWTPQDVAPALPASPDRIALTDVACPAPGACVATGSRGTVLEEPIILRQNGSGWTQLALPLPGEQLGGVSCRAVDDCLVRTPALDLHVGVGGVTVVPPTPQGGTDDFAFTDPSCVAAGCLQVEGTTSSWWNGTAWSTPVATPASLERFDRVLSCASATSCLLVGNSYPIEGWPTPGNVMSSVWNGTSWSTPVTVSQNSRVLDVACASPTTCFASAGVRADYWTGMLQNTPAPQVLRWNGSSWANVPLTYPGPAPTEPPSIACASATSCTALWVAGESNPASPSYLGRWNGTAWTVTATTAAATATSLGCGSSTSCVAVGGPTAQQLTGSSWATMPIASGTYPSEVLGQVSCATATSCMAIGSSRQRNAAGEEINAVPVTRRFDGSSWVTEPPDTHPTDELSCGSATSCMTALGRFGSFTPRHWNGSSWTTLPDVTDARIGGVTGMSCPTSTWCIATTSDFSTGAGNLSFVWSGGTTWSPLPALPNGSGTSRAVSCSAPGQCMVLTNFIGPHLYRLSGSTWTPVSLTGLGLGSLAELEDVGCTGPAECVVVGRQSYDSDDRPVGLLGALRNGTWTSTTRPNTEFIDVDCWSANGCAAIGSAPVVAGRPAIATYTGSAWRSVAAAPGLSQVRNISCGAPKTCEVTGGFVDGSSRAAVAKLVIEG